MSEEEESKQPASDHSRQDFWSLAPIVTKIKSYLRKRKAEREKEQPSDRAARKTANATVWIAIFTAAVIFVGGLQFLVMNGQLNEMQAERRPWVSIDVVPTDRINRIDGGNELRIRVKLKNTGEAAAVDVFEIAEIYPPLSGGDAIKQRVDFINCRGMIVGLGTGIALFPQESFEKDDTATEPDGIKPTIFPDEKFMKGTLSVCLSYKTAGRPRDVHITKKFYVMDASGGKGAISLIPVGIDAN